MDIQKAIELLPWYLNGTLAREEHSEVERHLANSEECRQALVETRAAATVFNAHLPAKALVAHAFGTTPGDIDPATVDRHLEHSSQDAELFELVMQSKGALEWSQRSEEKGSWTPASATAANDNSAVQRWRAVALAASLVCMIALAGWLTSGNRGGVSQQARAGSVTVDLEPTSVYRGEEEVARVVVGRTDIFMSFPLPRNADGPAYDPASAKLVKIVDAGGTVVYQVEGPAPSDSFYNVTLPVTAELEPGLHQVQLFEAGSSNTEPLAIYPFRVIAH